MKSETLFYKLEEKLKHQLEDYYDEYLRRPEAPDDHLTYEEIDEKIREINLKTTGDLRISLESEIFGRLYVLRSKYGKLEEHARQCEEWERTNPQPIMSIRAARLSEKIHYLESSAENEVIVNNHSIKRERSRERTFDLLVKKLRDISIKDLSASTSQSFDTPA